MWKSRIEIVKELEKKGIDMKMKDLEKKVTVEKIEINWINFLFAQL